MTKTGHEVICLSDTSYADRLFKWAARVWRDADVRASNADLREMAAAAGLVIVSEMFLPYANERHVDEFADYLDELPDLRSLPPAAFLELYDEIHDEFVNTVESEDDFRGAGWHKGMRAESMFKEALRALRPTWTNDIRGM